MTTITLGQNNGQYSNDTTVTGDPAIVLAGDGITLINQVRGRLGAASGASAAVLVQGVGSLVINTPGAVIGVGAAAGQASIIGGAGNDTVENSGSINGTVSLGQGNDIYRQYSSTSTSLRLDLGDGDDAVELAWLASSPSSYRYLPSVDGGTGTDTLSLSLPGGIIDGTGRIANVEHLILGGGIVPPQATAVTGLSGFLSVTVQPLFGVNFYDSDNPLANLAVNGGTAVVGPGSTFASATGSSGVDMLGISWGGAIYGAVNLGEGNDQISYYGFDNIYGFLGSVDLGGGYDTLTLSGPATNRIFDADLSNFVGLEEVSALDFPLSSPLFIRHARDIQLAKLGNRQVGLIDVVAPLATINAQYGDITIGADTVIGKASTNDLARTFQQLSNLVLPDSSQNSTIENRGSILGDVWFQYGNDLYDGRTGTVGGTVYGFAGNDTLYGGAQADRLNGGLGTDTIYGGGGADILTGGGDADIFHGTMADFNGDTITDFGFDDRLHLTDVNLANFTYSWNNNGLTIGQATINWQGRYGKVNAVASASGGVDVTISKISVQDDFNADGFSDFLFAGSTRYNIRYFADNTYRDFSGSYASGTTIVGIGDFNGDGFSDFIHRASNGTIRQVSLASTFTLNVTVATSWQSNGVGDFNGDGKSDIAWRNTNGDLTIWTSTGAGFANGAYVAGTPTSWQVQSIGDFNGDDKSDLLWRNSNGDITIWNSTGNGFANGAYIAGVSNNWHILGSGDFNRDGKDDIVWRHDNGDLNIWRSTGNGFTDGGYFNTPSSQNFAGIGDYNGDGRDDLVWSMGNTYTTWLATEDGFTPGYATLASADLFPVI